MGAEAAPLTRRALRWVAGAAAGFALLLTAGLVWFAIPPAAENRTAATDAIVVLTGGSLRLQRGVDLMREGKGRALFISGVNRRVGLDALLRVSGDAPRWLSCCIEIGYQAENTQENAQEAARWMRRRGYRSLRLVTAWYHMPRSRLEFERAMPDIEILPHPVFPEAEGEPHWWNRHGPAALLLGEYAKYLAVVIRPLIEPLQAPPAEPLEAEVRP